MPAPLNLPSSFSFRCFPSLVICAYVLVAAPLCAVARLFSRQLAAEVGDTRFSKEKAAHQTQSVPRLFL